MQKILVVASATMLLFATFVQARDILHGSRSTILTGWLIWTVVNVVSLFAQQHAGSSPIELLVPVSQLLSTLALFFVTCHSMAVHGRWHTKHGRDLSWSDAAAVLCCLVGVAGWVVFKDSYIAIWGNVAANIAGLLPILWRAWQKPHTVLANYWVLRGLSTFLATGVFVAHTLNPAGFIPQITGVIMAGVVLAVRVLRTPKTPALVEESES